MQTHDHDCNNCLSLFLIYYSAVHHWSCITLEFMHKAYFHNRRHFFSQQHGSVLLISLLKEYINVQICLVSINQSTCSTLDCVMNSLSNFNCVAHRELPTIKKIAPMLACPLLEFTQVETSGTTVVAYSKDRKYYSSSWVHHTQSSFIWGRLAFCSHTQPISRASEFSLSVQFLPWKKSLLSW